MSGFFIILYIRLLWKRSSEASEREAYELSSITGDINSLKYILYVTLRRFVQLNAVALNTVTAAINSTEGLSILSTLHIFIDMFVLWIRLYEKYGKIRMGTLGMKLTYMYGSKSGLHLQWLTNVLSMLKGLSTLHIFMYTFVWKIWANSWWGRFVQNWRVCSDQNRGLTYSDL